VATQGRFFICANRLVKVTYSDKNFHRYLYENKQNPQVLTGIVDGKGKRFTTKNKPIADSLVPKGKTQTYYVPGLPFAVGSPENIAVSNFLSNLLNRVADELQAQVDNASSQIGTIIVPRPVRRNGWYTCIARTQDLNRTSGLCPVVGWGWGMSKIFQEAKNNAVQMANSSIGAVDSHRNGVV
jgi:hypothetical protein